MNSIIYNNFLDGLAVDWVTNKIYFTDYVLNIIGVFDPVNFYYTVLVTTGNSTNPQQIVLDPSTG